MLKTNTEAATNLGLHLEMGFDDDISVAQKKMTKEDKAELDAAFAELKSKAGNVSGDSLSDWDRESLKIATEYVREKNRDEFRRTINRILELAGLSPEMEKEIFQRQQILKKEIEKKND